MSRYAYLVAPAKRSYIWLGKPTTTLGAKHGGFWIGSVQSSEEKAQRYEVLLGFLHHALPGEVLLIMEEDFTDEMAEYEEFGELDEVAESP